jgi:nitrogen fixation protein FixH
MTRANTSRTLSGKTVLLSLVAFFGVIAAVNAIMIYYATSTFAGLETENPYRAGIAYNRDIAAAEAQDARHWQVDAKLTRLPSERVKLVVHLRDASGTPLHAIDVEARLLHPTSARHDHAIAMNQTGAGTFSGEAVAEAGQWDLSIDVSRNGEQLFRSTSRRILR